MALRATFFGSDDPPLLERVQALRKTIFVDQCGWQLQVDRGLEADEFDGPQAVHLLLQDGDAARGCFRLVRTDRPYLARSVFPALASVFPYPARADAWEVSRFGVLRDERAAALGRVNYALMLAFAEWTRCTALVAMSGLAHERFLRSLGVRTRRYGPAREVGRDARGRPLLAVAGEIAPQAQDPACLGRLLSLLNDVEIVDRASLLGPRRLSA